MKKLLAVALFVSSLANAGTITTYFSASAPAGPETITWDAKTTIAAPSGASSPVAWNHTIGSGTDRAIIVGCATAFDVGTLAVTVGGNSMTRSTGTLDSSGLVYQTHVFKYANPSSGVQSISVSWTSGGSDHRVLCAAISYSGTNQASIIEVSTGAYSGNGDLTTTLTTLTDNDVLISVLNDNGAGTQTGSPTAGQTVQSYIGDVGVNNYSLYMSTRAVTTAGSYSDTWTGMGGPVQGSFVAIKPGP